MTSLFPDKIVTVPNLRPMDICYLVAQAKAEREAKNQVEAERSEQTGGEAIHRPHQEAMMTMLSEAFDEARLQGLFVHLVDAGWGDAAAENGLIQAIQRCCRDRLAAQGGETAAAPSDDGEISVSLDAAPVCVEVTPHQLTDEDPALPSRTSVKGGVLASAKDSSTGLNTSQLAIGDEDLAAQSSAIETGQGAEGNVDSLEPATAAAAQSALALAPPSNATETADGPTTDTNTVGGVISAEEAADVGLAAENEHEVIALATKLATPKRPTNQASADKSPAGLRIGKFWLDCNALGAICRYNTCQIGNSECAASATIATQAA
jgi:hypothetical protein